LVDVNARKGTSVEKQVEDHGLMVAMRSTPFSTVGFIDFRFRMM